VPRPLRFGILCNSIELEAWQVHCLEEVIKVPGCVPVVAVVNATNQTRPSFLRRLATAILSGRVGWSVFDRLVSSRSTPATRSIAPPNWLRHLPILECAVTRKGRYSEYFSEGDVEALHCLNLDFLIKFGFGITRGAILTVARYGIWSFHHDDETRYRGAPPGFWEIYLGDSVTGSILQRLTERLDAGIVLRRGYFQTIDYSYRLNRDQAYTGSYTWPAQVCRDILHGEAAYLDEPPASTNAPVYRYPSSLQVIVFCLRLARNWMKKQISDLFFCDIWNIGIVDESVETIARRGSIGKVRWLDTAISDRYFADPSGITQDGESWLFAEDFSYLRGSGVISARRIVERTAQGPWQAVLELPHHLSFPQVIEHEGKIYCLPECAGSGEIVLYVAEEFPHRWERAATLVENFQGVDSVVRFHEGRWWLFCTDGDQGGQTHLCVFHGDNFTGPYRPHANNPVKVDIRGSRAAGPLFTLDGALIRPAQNDAETYGRSITLNRIIRLTPEAYLEERLAELLPDARGPYPDGLHTIHALGDITLIDGKCRRFLPKVSLQRWIYKFTRILPSQITLPRTRS
jgi:hypothetical protein